MNEFTNKLKLLGLNDSQAIKMTSIFSTQLILNKNDYFLKEYSVSAQLGFIMNGMCRYFYVSDNGDEVTRWVSLENEFVMSFGSFIKQSKTHENIQAIVPTKIQVAQKEQWDSLYKEEEFARFLWTKSIEEYLIGIEARVYSLIALNALNRYERLMHNYPQLVQNG
jgi:hypothetical protein